MSGRRTKAQPMLPESRRDVALSAVADALESMQQNVAALNASIGVARKMMLLALEEPRDDDEDEDFPTYETATNGARRHG